MRINTRHRLALVAAAATLATLVGAVHGPSAAIYASSLYNSAATYSHAVGRQLSSAETVATTPLTAGNFQEIAQQGFGDPQNSFAWSMEWYKGKLYVGTNRAWRCTQQAAENKFVPFIFPYPPLLAPDLAVPCAPYPQAIPLAGEIWAFDPARGTPFTQTNWNLAYRSPYTVSVPITATDVMTPAPRDMGFRGMTVYDDGDPNGPALYVSGVGTSEINGPNVPPPSLLRTTDGTNFQAVPANPGTTMGDINKLPGLPAPGCCIRGAVSYLGQFFVVIGGLQGAGRVFVSSNPAAGDNSFMPLAQSQAVSTWAYELQPFNGHLYIGMQSSRYGYSVLRTDCVTPPCPASAFTQVVPPGGGLGDQGSFTITSMHVFTDTNGVPHLYVGTDGLGKKHQAAELIRINPTAPNQPDSWDLIVGKARTVNGVTKSPLSGLGAGFGWPFNVHMWRMEDYNGVLYVGTFDNSNTWLHTIIGPFLRPYMGFDLWASSDGVNFTPVTQNGFGDPYTSGARTLKATSYGLFVGGANMSKGLRIWLGSIAPSAMQQAPQNLQVDRSNGGKPALAWTGTSTLVNYHVYRSTATWHAVPSIPAGAAGSSDDSMSSSAQLASPVLVPGVPTEIGSTTNRYFVDETAQPGSHYTYYIVGDDTTGKPSLPSNVVTIPALEPSATFRYVQHVLVDLWSHARLSNADALHAAASLAAAQARLRAGDAAGSRAILDVLRRQILSDAQGADRRMAAEALATNLYRLEVRESLVGARVLAASALE